MKTGRFGYALCGLTLCAALASAGPASAALTVSSSGDSGGCSLRATIEDVNNGTAGGCGTLESGTTTIEVPGGHYLLTSGELKVKAGAGVKIVGADPAHPEDTVIDGDQMSRDLEVAASGQATLYAVELTGGATLHGVDATAPEGYGAPAESGGGILNFGSVTLEHALVTENRTGRGGNGGDGTLTNTLGRNGGGANAGGNGGGISNESGASLVVVDSTISHNVTGEGGAGGTGSRGQTPAIGNIPAGGAGGNGGHGGSGGGIYNAGSATITDTTLSDNQTGRAGPGGQGGEGSGPSSEFSGGTGGYGGEGGNNGLLYGFGSDDPTYVEYTGGGGIANLGALTMSDSTIADNNTGAGGLGGGAGLGGAKAAPASGRETGGKAGLGGGGGLGGGLLSIGTSASLTNVTISGNRTGDGGNGGAGAQSSSRGGGAGGFGGYGGGISAYGTGKPGLQLTFVTIAGNLLGAEGHGGEDHEFPGFHGGPGKGAGIATGPSYGSGGGVTLANSIVAGNESENCNQFAAGAILDGGHDVSYLDSTCPGTNGNPLLGALADNGGPTETLLPGAGSSVIAIVPSGSCSPYMDQRGLSRPGSGKSACDAGAVETGGGSGGGTTATTTSLSSSGSPSTVGATVTFVATVSPSPGGGTVAFKDGGAVISGCAAKPVVSGQATCPETFPIASSHAIVAEYSGTSGFSGSTSATFTQVVQNESTGGGGGGGTGGGGGATGGGSGGSTGGGSGGSGSGGGGATVGTPKAGAPKVSGTTVSVPITCAGPTDVTCVVKLLLSASGGGGKASPRVVARAKGGAKKLTVGVATATIAGGATKTVSVSLDGAAKKALAKAHRLKATLTATQKGGTKPLLVRSVTFKKG